MYTFKFPVTIGTRDNGFPPVERANNAHRDISLSNWGQMCTVSFIRLQPLFGASNASTVIYAYMYILSMQFFILPGQSRL